MTTFNDVATFIGQASENEITSIFALCKQRTRMLRTVTATENLATLKVGDIVTIHGISPKYLNGETATVVNLFGTKAGSVQVRLNNSVGRFSGVSPIGVPASCLTKTA